MSRKISELAAFAFQNNTEFSQGATAVLKSRDGRITMLLHGCVIARIENGVTSVTLAGWPTPTTRDRLNAIDGVTVKQSKGVQYINDKAVGDFSWVVIRG